MIEMRIKNPITLDIVLKAAIPNHSFSEKPAEFFLVTRFFQGKNRVLNRLGMEKK